MEDNGISTLLQIKSEEVEQYYQHLQQRTNIRTGEGQVSTTHVNAEVKAIKQFAQFVYKTKNRLIPLQHIRLERIERKEKQALTKEEVGLLFKTISGNSRYALRDRAMLSVYYGCGLRRNEGTGLHISDIDFIRGFVFVRNGKGCKERFVPMSEKVMENIKTYLHKGRPLFTKNKRNKALFLNYKGEALGSNTFYYQLKHLQRKAGCDTLKEKNLGLHTLRHSIASHLLHNNVPLESICKFLGHSTLESTQIYTHIEH